MTFMDWYNSLAKPAWTPEPAFIGLMWRIIYPIIIVTFGFVFIRAARKRIPRAATIPFLINIIANLAFTPILFGLRNLTLATVDILVVWGSIVWLVLAIRKHHPWVAIAQIPYFVWVSIATVLQLSINWMNR